jgi:hypothetical protein
MVTHGPYAIGDGPATGRQEGTKPQHEEPVMRWSGKSRLKHPEHWHRKVWPLHTLGLSWRWLALSQLIEPYCTMKGPLFPTSKRAKVELNRTS